MNRKKRKKSMLSMLFFCIGLVLYLTGILLIFNSSLRKVPVFNVLFSGFSSSNEVINKMKLVGGILFLVGFAIFLIAVVFLYKNNEVQDNNKNLIIEGKADVITLIVMTYVMIFMVVVCLIFDQLVGALLFGVTIMIQSILNGLLIKYFNKEFRKK